MTGEADKTVKEVREICDVFRMAGVQYHSPYIYCI